MATPLPGGTALRRALTPAVAAAVALMLAAAPALATVTAETFGGDTVSIQGDANGDVITVSCAANVANVNGTAPLPALACTAVQYVDVEATLGSSTVNLGGLTKASFANLRETSVAVDDGYVDSVTGSEGRDVVHADFNDDVSTGGGDDWVEGAGSASGLEGNDTFREVSSVQGGPGDDLVVNPGSGPLDGGTGFDTLVYDYSTFTSQQAVVFTLTDASINGVVATAGIEAYDIRASDGEKSDFIDSQGYSGRVTFHGRAGKDRFVGGPGADVADVGAGDDAVDPGPGSDFVAAGDGDDAVSVRDGFGDVVECGPGTDSVTADRFDVLSGCENVSLLAPETSQVSGPLKVTKGDTATFTFGSPVAGSSFECRVDAGAFTPCASPFALKISKLAAGQHMFLVRAVQPAGNADQSPSSFIFKVKNKKKQQQ